MNIESRNQREIKCMTIMRQSILVTPHEMHGSGEKFNAVSVESGRCSLDLSRVEALELAAAIVWAANGGSTS